MNLGDRLGVSLTVRSHCFPLPQERRLLPPPPDLVILLLSHLWDGFSDAPAVWGAEPLGKVLNRFATGTTVLSVDWCACSQRLGAGLAHQQHPFVLQ